MWEAGGRDFLIPAFLVKPLQPRNLPYLLQFEGNISQSKFADYFQPPAHTQAMSFNSRQIRFAHSPMLDSDFVWARDFASSAQLPSLGGSLQAKNGRKINFAHFKRRFLLITIFRINITDSKVVSIFLVFLQFFSFFCVFSTFFAQNALFLTSKSIRFRPQNRPSAEPWSVLSHPSPELQEQVPIRLRSLSGSSLGQAFDSHRPSPQTPGAQDDSRDGHPFSRAELTGLAELSELVSLQAAARVEYK